MSFEKKKHASNIYKKKKIPDIPMINQTQGKDTKIKNQLITGGSSVR